MKNYIIILMAVVLGTMACNEKSELATNNSSFDPSTIAVENGGPGIKIKGKPYRTTEDRERDGKNCGCKFCFGLCDIGIEVDLDLKDFGIIANLPNNTADVYLLENLANAEAEFGIDTPLNIPSSYLTGTGINQLTLNAGLYDYIAQVESITINGVSYTSYGKATINISHN